MRSFRGRLAACLALLAVLLSACSERSSVPSTSSTSTSTSTTVAPSSTTTSAPTTTSTSTTTTTLPVITPFLELGSSGARVLALQRRLSALGYWLGPDDGVFGDSTQQAVYAIQKAAGIERDGIVGPETDAALNKGVVPVPRPAVGHVIEIDLNDDLLMFVDNGKLMWTLNTSTGGGYTYEGSSGPAVALTPVGIFYTYRVIDGLDIDPLGELWRPRFFTDGFAIHGDSYVPPEPVSHGCVRVSNEAIDWIWAENLDPIGMEVWVYGS